MAKSSFQIDKLRLTYGFWIIVIGFFLVAMLFMIAVSHWTKADDVVTVIAVITTFVGTIVGAFFGVQVGSAGKERAENERKQAENLVLEMAKMLSSKQVDNARKAAELNE